MPRTSFVHAPREALSESARQERDVLATFPKRGHSNRKDVQAVVEIFAERPVLDHRTEVAIRGGNQPRVARNRAAATDSLELALLDDAQELRLEVEGHLADLVEKQRAVLRELKRPVRRARAPVKAPFS